MNNYDWSRLITINYASGFGGDFFSKLLHLAVNNVNEIEDGKNEWLQYKGINSPFVADRQCYIKPFRSYSHDLRESSYFKDGRSVNTPYFGIRVKPYKMKEECWNEDRQIFVRNLEKRFSLIYKPSSYECDIVNTHNVSLRSTRVSIQEVFPGSKNICLMCSSYSQWLIFKVLYLYKNEVRHLFRGNSEDELIVIESAFRDNYVAIPTNIKKYIEDSLNWYSDNMFDKDELNINAFDMYFNQVNFDSQLSNFLNKDVKLSNDYLKRWKLEAENILSIFDMRFDETYTLEQATDKVINYIVNNRPFYNSNV